MKKALILNLYTLFSIGVLLVFQGCAYRVITDYDNCVPQNLTFEFKDKYALYIIDDGNAENPPQRYTSMNFEKGEHYICIDSSNSSDSVCGGTSKSEYNVIRLKNQPFHLTGKYKHNDPNLILGLAVSDSHALQADFNGTIVWISIGRLAYKHDHKEYTHKNIDYIFKESSNHRDFECPLNSRVTDFGFTY